MVSQVSAVFNLFSEVTQYLVALVVVILESLLKPFWEVPNKKLFHKKKESTVENEAKNSTSSDSLLSTETPKPKRLGKTTVEFRIRYRTEYGQSVHVVGSEGFLGKWSVDASKGLRCARGDDFQTVRVRLPLNEHKEGDGSGLIKFEYKYLLRDSRNNSVVWESGNNRVLVIEPNIEENVIYKVDDRWNFPQSQTVSKNDITLSDAKAFIVLGKRLEANGTVPCLLSDRMKHAARAFLADTSEDKYMIVTGGKTQGGVIMSEAEAMKQLAMDYGIPEPRIILEDCAMNTIENAFYSKEILEDMGIHDVVVITSDFHMERSKRIFGTFLSSEYSVEYDADCPQLQREMLLNEQLTEASMLLKLKDHLSYYEK